MNLEEFEPIAPEDLPVGIAIENLSCPHCGADHYDCDEWAIRNHKTHLCQNCKREFEGSFKAVSRPSLMRSKA